MQSPPPDTQRAPTIPAPVGSRESVAHTHRAKSVAEVFNKLEEVRHSPELGSQSEIEYQEQLVSARLGVASSLFIALRAKHPPSAAHCLRVALGVSSWAEYLDISAQQRDELEIASLLHDVGKIGVPDHIITKPGKLSADEFLAMEKQRRYGSDILMACTRSQSLLDIIRYSQAWYDGRRHGFDKKGEDLPLGARVIAIVDAFDSMTTDHVYRKAMSRERALAEMFEYAGTQFDPELIRDFYALLAADRVQLSANVARRWLQQLLPDSANTWWSLEKVSETSCEPTINELFHERLFDSMYDGVICVDTQMRILRWNRAAERLTGLSCSSVMMQCWEPTMVKLHDDQQRPVDNSQCPLANVVSSGIQTLNRFSMIDRQGNERSVNAHLIPVVGKEGMCHGAAFLFHDATTEVAMEEQVVTLYKKATCDALTQCANRAEFDRQIQEFTARYEDTGEPFSLIICDVDHFKLVNDTFGHQAGDDTLISFSALLRRCSRDNDLVARYGGEEFVLLCPQCDIVEATAKAELIRQQLASTIQPQLAGKSIKASFGVTEVQPGDTPESILRRSDRALYQAKEGGRNRVVQLGVGASEQGGAAVKSSGGSWMSWLSGGTNKGESGFILERALVTTVPISVAAEKLKGFVSDHQAEIQSVDENGVALLVDGPNSRRNTDRTVPFQVEIKFEETHRSLSGRVAGIAVRTLARVVIQPKRNRDRRRRDVEERAMQILGSLRSYLMAQEVDLKDENLDEQH
ncbi:MAG: diguanylate cyclase (GGDEF)-like protein/PAS domain S-box-containing protein [Pirellulaceae bacterium]